MATDAVVEARAAIRSRPGLSALAAGVGFDTIERLQPGLLERHVHAMLTDLAGAVEPFWLDALKASDIEGHFVQREFDIAAALISVVDDYVDQATDAQAIAIYKQLRGRAPTRIAEQMPRLAYFLDRHTAPVKLHAPNLNLVGRAWYALPVGRCVGLDKGQ